MSIAKRGVHGLTHFEPGRAFDGYTLFAPMYGKSVWLIDMEGQIVHSWEMENIPGNYGKLLANGSRGDAAFDPRMATAHDVAGGVASPRVTGGASSSERRYRRYQVARLYCR